MKKFLSILLAILMVASLAACGKTEPAQSDSTAPAVEAVNLVVASSYKDSDAEGQYMNYFMDYVTEKSGGSITFTKYMGGTLGSPAEEMGLLQNGDVDVIAMYAPVYAFEIPEFTCILNAVGTAQDSIDFFHHICYENESTAPLFAAALDKYNAELLGCVFAVGRTVFPCTKEVASWNEVREKLTLGAISSYPEMEGYKSYSVIDPTTYYESLRTGLVQCVETSCDSALAGKLYEVAPYVISTKIYSPFNQMVVNKDTMASLTSEQQQILKDAAAAAEKYSLEVCDKTYNDFVAACESAGGKVIDMTEAELNEYWDLQFKANYSSILVGLAPAAGAVDQANAIVGAILDYWNTGYTVEDVAGFAQ